MSATRQYARARERATKRQAIALLQKMPKPPSHDGQCACGCCHKPDKGPCHLFRRHGREGRCDYCDHGILCHRRKGEPMPKEFNQPLKVDEKGRP